MILEEKLQGVEKEIEGFYEAKQIAPRLVESILYSVRAGGKRIRPLLLLELLEAFHAPILEAHFQVAAALEMIHTGSLIHDDLPAMDNDDYRRGQLTNHKKFGEDLAILAGDSLFLDAFGCVAEADLPTDRLIIGCFRDSWDGSRPSLGYGRGRSEPDLGPVASHPCQ